MLAPILLLRNRSSLRVRGSHLVQFFLLGILGLAASNFFYYFAIEKTTVATAIVLQYVAPVWVLLYMLARRLQRPTLRRISGVVLAVIGCGLAVGGIAAQRGFPWLAISGPRFDTLGVIAAEMAAISFAFYNVYGQHLLQIYNRWTVLVYALLGAAVFWLVVNPPWKIVAQHYSGGQWLFMVVFAIVSMLVPFSLYFTGLQHLDPTRAIVTACLEPVWAILLTAIILGELVSPMQVVGIVVVLAATILIQRPERRDRGEPSHRRRANRVATHGHPSGRSGVEAIGVHSGSQGSHFLKMNHPPPSDRWQRNFQPPTTGPLPRVHAGPSWPLNSERWSSIHLQERPKAYGDTKLLVPALDADRVMRVWPARRRPGFPSVLAPEQADRR